MCKNCELNPVYEFTNKRKLCKICFIRYFHKKVFFNIRRFDLVNNGDIIEYSLNDFRDVVLEDILKIISEKILIVLSKKHIRNSNKLAVSSTLDIEAERIIKEVLHGDVTKLNEIMPISKSRNKIMIMPLYFFLDEEVLLYSKLRKLNIKNKKEKKDKIGLFIDEMEQKHPEVKRAIVNSYIGLFT